MRHLCLIILMLCITFPQAWGQKEKRSSGEYQLNLSKSDFSEREACEYCLEVARVEAIEKAFGTVIIQGNTTVIKNVDTGEEIETSQVFNMMAETYVNGDWIKTLDENCERFTSNGDFWLKCRVKGVVRELTAPKLEMEVKTLDCPEKTCETFNYIDGESFYLHVKSPESGYISVYLSDSKVTQRLFPYRNMPEGWEKGGKVKADQEYVLFSRKENAMGLRGYIDELELYAETSQDQNRLYVIYSDKPLGKPLLTPGETIASGYDMPMELSAESFHRWLAQNRQYQEVLQVERLDITISK